MNTYLTYHFEDNENFINTYDELPFWSAPFGLMMLKHLELKPGISVIDIGSGTGFPLMELAGRLGSSCKIYGLDPWVNANKRAKQKIKNYAYHNVELVETSAENIPFDNQMVDLITCNLGLNNFENPGIVIKECQRVLKKGGQMVITTNLNGHWQTFYSLFEAVLQDLKKPELAEVLKKEQEHRGTIESISALFTENGFSIKQIVTDNLEMKFVDGSAFLNHHFVKPGWLTSWRELIPKKDRTIVFSLLEEKLNFLANQTGTLTLNVPMAYIEVNRN